MKFEEVISLTDQEIIKNFITQNATRFNQELQLRAPLSHIMRDWETEKSHWLYKLLGNNITISKPYSWAVRREDRIEEMKRVLTRTLFGREFYEKWMKLIDTLAHNHELTRDGNYYNLQSLPGDSWRLVDNVCGLRYDVPMPDGKKYKVEPNTKAIRAIKKIAEAYNIPGVVEFVNKHSQALNRPDRDVEITLSIHPMDYMTMSENSTWSSCMKWSDVGDYRQGTVEMMNSSCVVVAYISWSEYGLTGWNDKKWRKLFIVDESLILGVRGYPYEDDNLDVVIMEWLKELAETNLGWSYEDKMIWAEGDDGERVVWYEDDNYNEVGSFEIETGFMYSDFYNKHPLYLSKTTEYGCTLCYSGRSMCMLCGDTLYWDDASGCTLACYDCEPVAYCACCSEDYPSNEMMLVDGEHICPHCYEDRLVKDFYTAEVHIPRVCQRFSVLDITKDYAREIHTDSDYDIYVYKDNLEQFVKEHKCYVFKRGYYGSYQAGILWEDARKIAENSDFNYFDLDNVRFDSFNGVYECRREENIDNYPVYYYD